MKTTPEFAQLKAQLTDDIRAESIRADEELAARPPGG
jgi:hypothetical protein